MKDETSSANKPEGVTSTRANEQVPLSAEQLEERIRFRLPSIERAVAACTANGELSDYDDELANSLHFAVEFLTRAREILAAISAEQPLTHLSAAAPMLFGACVEFVRKVEAGEARSTRSYLQMKQAVAFARTGDIGVLNAHDQRKSTEGRGTSTEPIVPNPAIKED